MKYCKSCKTLKNESCFTRDRWKLQTYCSVCKAIYWKKRAELNNMEEIMSKDNAISDVLQKAKTLVFKYNNRKEKIQWIT